METSATAVTTPICIRHLVGRCTSWLLSAALHVVGHVLMIYFSLGMLHFPLRRNWIGRLRLALIVFGLPYTVCTHGGRYVMDNNVIEI